MKILFFEDSSKSLFGGGQKISSFILNILNNNDSIIYYYDFKKNEYLQSILNKNLSKNKILLHYHNENIVTPYVNILFSFLNCFILIFVVKKYKINFAYAPNKRSLFYSFILNQIFDLTFIYHAHMILQNKWYDKYLIYAIKKAKYCVCVSDFVQNEYIKKDLHNTIVINNPLENEVIIRNKSTVSYKNINVAFFGTISKIKGVNYLLESIKYLSNINVTISIYGEGGELDNLKSLYSLNERIFFHGFITDVIKKIDEIDLLVLPTIIPEAAPTIIQQAMSRGVPIVTTNIGGQKYLVKDNFNGILIEPKNCKCIANAIKIFYNDNKFYNFVSLNNSQAAKKFTTMKNFNDEITTLFYK